MGTRHRRGGYRSFEKAREFVRKLGLKNKVEWQNYVESNIKPEDIPSDPRYVYQDKGWVSWGDWLGTDFIAHQNRNYLPFEEARAFVHTVGLTSQTKWNTWINKGLKPDNIPSNPQTVYKDEGWKGWGDWLGTGAIASQSIAYLPFEEARAFARTLVLERKEDWVVWTKTDAKPTNIPAYPDNTYRDKGWAGWGDWLGTGRIANQDRMYLPFKEARAFVHRLDLKSGTEWEIWTKTGAKPINIPVAPDRIYKNKGWTSWGDWLGTGIVAPQNRNFLPFAEARAFARGLGLRNQSEWIAWAKSGEKPEDTPAHPSGVYKDRGWISWGDWLGTGNRKGGYRPFEEARAFVRKLGLKDYPEWRAWAKTNARPDDIPATPNEVYIDSGWISIGDWLGTGSVWRGNIIYRSFDEARKFARNLGLKSSAEWHKWSKTNAKPGDIPANPPGVYKGEGWSGWGDWLGVINLWNRNAILSFLRSIESVIANLKPTELFAIMRQNGILAAASHVTNTNSPLIKSIRDLCSSPNPEADFEKIVAQIEQQNAALEDDKVDESEETTLSVVPTADEAKDELPQLRSLAALKAVDMLVEAGITSDEETIEFLIANRVALLWQAQLNGELAVEQLRDDADTRPYFNQIRRRFMQQYDGALSLPIPAEFSFRQNGAYTAPNLMQRLTAYRVFSERRLGNWSGVGAGKTLAAILSSRVIDARLTLVVAFNSTLQAWRERIIEAFPDSDVLVKERGEIEVKRDAHTYLILNFETFQQPYAAELVRRLVAQHQIDFIVLDEIQSVKQRSANVESRRRQALNGLLSAASEQNPELCVMGMSATPVINNLFEAKALLEMVKGVRFDDLKTFSSIANASAMHEKLILYGIRYRPKYDISIETRTPAIDGEAYLPRLAQAKTILATERVLLDAKMPTLLGALRKGTLVYCHYVTDLVAPLRKAIERAGFRVGVYTGEDKSGLGPFKAGKVDVLIGSVPVGTGVDGLQYVCNRLVVVSLPWTSAEYEQLVGRLYRQGAAHDKVEVIIPQVVLARVGDESRVAHAAGRVRGTLPARPTRDEWSWDKMRWLRIQYKKTLADAALDGVIPEGELASPETMQKQAREALLAWIARVEAEGVTTIERAAFKVPLPTSETRTLQRRFGDFSQINNRINHEYSQTTHERFTQHPEEWYLYHTLYREARQSWSEIPFVKIAESLKKRPDWVIGDFGCGEALLAQLLPNTVHSFDHVAIDERVTACDMAHTPLADETLDVAVFSLSLMGLNYADYLREAHRTLKFGGMLKIAETIER